jgi:translocation and assembly module TamB
MRRLALALFAASALLGAPAAVQAQADDDRTRIERFLENQLSDGARQVSIQGFRGALSSTAEMDRLTIADAEGVWLILEGAELNWSRAALLRGRLRIDSLTADRLEILRSPVTEERLDLPPAETTPFALPELPLSISIARASIARVSLGPSFIGTPVELQVDGSASLGGGEGEADLEIVRLDGPRGVFDLAAAYDNETRRLTLSLLLEEDAGGLAANLLNIPGTPELRLSVEGDGPIDAFSAEIALSSDGQPRLTGTVATTLFPETGVREVTARLGGDITPLFLPDYRAFFGPDVALDTRLRLMPDGAVNLDTLTVTAAALRLNGTLALAPGGRPEAFAFTGRIADPEGAGPVRLPIPDATITVENANIVLSYDRESGASYTALALATGLDLGTARIGTIRIDADGEIAETPEGLVVRAPIRAGILDLVHQDPALQEALGSNAQLSADLGWRTGGPVTLDDLVVRAGDLALTGAATLDLEEGRLDLATDLAAEAGNLARFARATGQPLAGGLSASLTAEAELLSGAFDIVLRGTGTDLRIAEAVPPQLFAGETQLTLSAQRDETGLALRELTLTGREASLSGTGRINSDGAIVAFNARLANVGLFTDTLSGPVSASLDATRGPGEDAPWRIVSAVSSAAGITADISGSVAADAATADLRATGQLPLSLANRALAPRSVFGALAFDLRLSGPPTLTALSGSFRSSDARITLPTLQTALENVAVSGQLSGGRVSFSADGGLGSGGTVTAQGTVDLTGTGLPARIEIGARDLRLVDPTLYDARIARADIAVQGALTGALQVSGDIALGETELRVPENGLGATAPIPPITHIRETEAERRTRIAAGLGPQRSGTGGGGSQRIGLDLTISAPGRIFIRGRGLDAELGGQLRIGGTTANVIPTGRFDLVRGRFSILGTRLDLTEGSASLQGNFDVYIRLRAVTRAGEYQIAIELEGPVSAPAITLSSTPALPEDEILAQLLFGRSVSSLSPVQLLQMADAAATLAGGGSGGGGILANLREGLGLDDLDLQTDAEGNAALRAGRYLSDNVYTDVTVGSDGNADLSLNIDLTPNITARGSFSSDGTSSLGVFFERDY